MITQIGIHRVKHGDIMDGIGDLMNGEKADIIYTDPPWGQGHISYWQTLNVKMNGAQRVEINYSNFINQIFKVATEFGKSLLFVEYGQRWRDDIQRFGNAFGWKSVKIVGLQYGSTSKLLPLDLHVFAMHDFSMDQTYFDNIKGSYGYPTLQKVITPIAQKGLKILDPCCGMGYTAQIAVDTGMQFFGNELNHARLQKTIKRLS